MTPTTDDDDDMAAPIEITRALMTYWRQQHAEAWQLIGRIDYALDQIIAAPGAKEARAWARRMRDEIAARTRRL